MNLIKNSSIIDFKSSGSDDPEIVTPPDDPDLVADCSDQYPDCAVNEFDCAGECGGDAVVDECGECGGDGIDDGACECEGNVSDCAGV